MAVSILNATDSEKLFENERSLKRESGIEEVRSSSEEGLVCYGELSDKSSVELAANYVAFLVRSSIDSSSKGIHASFMVPL
jgi:hypothetical protein